MKRARLVLGVVAGLMLLASSAAHSILGWKSLAEQLANTNVSSDLLTGLRIGWTFQSLEPRVGIGRRRSILCQRLTDRALDVVVEFARLDADLDEACLVIFAQHPLT